MNVIWFVILGFWIVLWMWRFLTESGCFIPLGRGKKQTEKGKLWRGGITVPKNRQGSGETVSHRELLGVFLAGIGFRLIIYLSSVVVVMMFGEGMSFGMTDFLNSWNVWDAPHYLELAEKGYAACIEDGKHLFLVFFPLYPWLVRGLHLLIGNWQAAALILSTVCFALGTVFFYLLITEEYGRTVARKALVLFSVYPFSFFFGGIMTESLFFCLMAAGFYAVKRHQWPVVGIIGIFCSLCRVQGILLLGVAGVEFFVYYKPFRMIRRRNPGLLLKTLFTRGIWLLLMPVGNLIYLGLNWRIEGDPFRFQVYQAEHWGHKTVYFTEVLNEIWNYIFSPATSNTLKICIWIPELLLFLLTVTALFYAVWRHPLKYTAFLTVYLLVNYSVTFLISGGRYLACALPLFIIGGEFFKRHPVLYQGVVCVSAVLMGIYMAGYLTWKQVM